MSDEQTLAAVGDLNAAAALGWAADCVEHLAQQVGDTGSEDVAACVGLARKYAQDQVYDPVAAKALSDAVRRARRKRKVSAEGVFEAIGLGASVALGEAIGWPDGSRIDMLDSSNNSGPSDYTQRKRELRAEMAALLDAAQALCGVNPVDAARDASTLCRKAVPVEAIWQMQRLTSYQKPPPQSPPPSPARSTA